MHHHSDSFLFYQEWHDEGIYTTGPGVHSVSPGYSGGFGWGWLQRPYAPVGSAIVGVRLRTGGNTWPIYLLDGDPFDPQVVASVIVSGVDGTVSMADINGTPIGTPATIKLLPNVLGNVEVKINLGTGAVTFQVNGAPAGTASIAAPGAVGFLRLNNELGSEIRGYYAADDQGADHNDFYGDVRFGVSFPEADRTKQWAPSSGADCWPMVDDPTGSDEEATYCEVAEADKRSGYQLAPVEEVDSDYELVAADIYARARKEDSGERWAQVYEKVGATEQLGPAVALAVGWAYYHKPAALNPATGANWLFTELFGAAGAEIGMQTIERPAA